MTKKLRRVQIQSEHDLRTLLDELRKDRIPRLIEENGEPIAVILDPADYIDQSRTPKSRAKKERIMSFAGIWGDLDADQMIADIYQWRDEAPPSPDPGETIDNERSPEK